MIIPRNFLPLKLVEVFLAENNTHTCDRRGKTHIRMWVGEDLWFSNSRITIVYHSSQGEGLIAPLSSKTLGTFLLGVVSPLKCEASFFLAIPSETYMKQILNPSEFKYDNSPFAIANVCYGQECDELKSPSPVRRKNPFHPHLLQATFKFSSKRSPRSLSVW